nr:uncharacterized protein LOC115266749 [Aedes albopictus]
MVGSYAITDANYVEVWDRLNEFYGKKKYTVAALVKEFVDQPPVTAPTLVGLRKLTSTSDDVVRQLKALGEEYESRDPWLIHLLLEKLDRETRSLWAQMLVDEDNPSFQDFITFLERRCDALETCASFSKKGTDATTKKEQERKVDPNTKVGKQIQSFHANTQQACPQCTEAHTIYQCASFKRIPVVNRRELVQRAKLCFNCLKATHGVKNCTSPLVCKQCKQKHHSLLCTSDSSASDSGQPREEAAAKKQEAGEPKQADSVASYVADLKTSCSVNFLSLLPTAVVKVLGKNNVFHEVRAMVDSACMNSLISKQAFERLGLERRNANILVSGITDGKPSKTTGAVTLQISSRFDDRIVIVVDALILNHLVPDQPSHQFDVDVGALAEAPLADPTYNECEPGKLYDGRGVPVAQNSVFGYLVGGHFNTARATDGRPILGLATTTTNLDQTLRKFWEVEEVPKSKQLTPDELRAVEHFHSTLSRTETGRYVVRLPFDRTKPELGESATAAIRRFKAMERKFSIDPELQQHYRQFMTEYEALGHMEKIPPKSDAVQDEPVHMKLPQEDDSVKALGIRWSPQDDTFSFKLSFDIDSTNTKRQLLSDSSKFFDPFGWIAPVIIRMKILFQHLWLYDLGWDDPLPAFILEEWITLKETLHHIERIRIRRWIPHAGGKLQLHGFADASEAAYAAVVYARTVNQDGRVETNLVVAKTRVAPILQVSLPRLELMAAELLVDLMVKVQESFSHLEVELFAWSDSEIVLHWLTSLPRKWKTFVANRTSKILQHLPRNHWRHVSSKDNPADCASRGVTPLELLIHPLWWRGPGWLAQPEDEWPTQSVRSVMDDELLEQRTSVTCLHASATACPSGGHETLTYLLNRYSNLSHIRRVLCWINRLRHNALARKRGVARLEGPLTPKEIDNSCLQLARAAQGDCFQRKSIVWSRTLLFQATAS